MTDAPANQSIAERMHILVDAVVQNGMSGADREALSRAIYSDLNAAFIAVNGATTKEASFVAVKDDGTTITQATQDGSSLVAKEHHLKSFDSSEVLSDGTVVTNKYANLTDGISRNSTFDMKLVSGLTRTINGSVGNGMDQTFSYVRPDGTIDRLTFTPQEVCFQPTHFDFRNYALQAAGRNDQIIEVRASSKPNVFEANECP